MLEIETPRLFFRRFTPDDLQDLSSIRADPEVMKYVAAGRPESIAEVQVTLSKVLTHWEQHGFGYWALIDKSNKNLMGWSGLSFLGDTGDVEIGYGMAKSYWGRGFASEAAAATIKYGFEQLNLPRIVAVAWPENVISQRVMEKLGMKYVKNEHFHFYDPEVVYYAISLDDYRLEHL
jgi:RimJ/RimL family protein N-acetyltransferase